MERTHPQSSPITSNRLERVARAGHATKGIVYALIGLLAAQAALGFGGATTDADGALSSILTQPFGRFLLAVIAIGLVAFALWRVAEALLDAERRGTDAEGIAKRAGAMISALVYGGLALTAARLALGSGGAEGGNAPEDLSARVMSWTLGPWLVGLAGLIVIVAGGYQLFEAYKASFRKDLNEHEMDPAERTWAIRLGRFGLAARGVVFGIIGIFLIQAALQADPSQAQGIGEALNTVAAQPFGRFLLGIVAFGLIAYGIYMGVLARYRRFKV